MSAYNLVVVDVNNDVSVMIEGKRPSEDMAEWTPATRLIMALSGLCQDAEFLQKVTGAHCNPIPVSVADNLDMVKAAIKGKSS